MDCPNCQSAIEETQKFCRICGVKLQMTCSGCGSAIFSGDGFCSECGLEPKISKRAAGKKIASERKYITVLFADISGYTPCRSVWTRRKSKTW